MLERDVTGGTALRLRNVVVRDATGSVIESAPNAEVGIAGLLSGSLAPERLSLIGAEMSLRIEADGRVAIFAGADNTAAAPVPLATSGIASASASPGVPPVEVAGDPLAALLAWIDKLDSLGLDGGSLSEIGLNDCMLVVDDRRSGKRWSFEHIKLVLKRPRDGGIAFEVISTGAGGQ